MSASPTYFLFMFLFSRKEPTVIGTDEYKELLAKMRESHLLQQEILGALLKIIDATVAQDEPVNKALNGKGRGHE